MKRPPGKDMLERVRDLRREMTPQEKLLWGQLRARRLEGAKFRKQMWLAGSIADFACPEARRVIEADGSQHADQIGYDAARERAFSRLGWRTLRFWNNEIMKNLEGVLTVIAEALPSPSHPAAPGGPLPLPETGEGKSSIRTNPSPFRGEGGARGEAVGG